LIDVTSSTPRLVGLRGFSICGDETNQVYLDSDKEDAWLFAESHEDEIDGDWNNAFSVSSGDDAVDYDDIHRTGRLILRQQKHTSPSLITRKPISLSISKSIKIK
jgi:hypothetical protein